MYLPQVFTATMKPPVSLAMTLDQKAWIETFKQRAMCTLHWSFQTDYLLPEALNYALPYKFFSFLVLRLPFILNYVMWKVNSQF